MTTDRRRGAYLESEIHGTSNETYFGWLEHQADKAQVNGRAGNCEGIGDISWFWDGRLAATFLIMAWETLLARWEERSHGD